MKTRIQVHLETPLYDLLVVTSDGEGARGISTYVRGLIIEDLKRRGVLPEDLIIRLLKMGTVVGPSR